MRKPKVSCALVLAASFAALCSCANPTASSKPTTTEPDTTETKATLAAYGITEVAAKSASDPQPYGTKVAAVLPRKQIYFDGLSYLSSDAPRSLDYKGNVPTVGSTGNNFGWTTSPHASIPARLGTDGKESIVSVVFTPDSTAYTVGENKGKVTIQVWNGLSVKPYTPFKGSDKESFSLYLSGWGSMIAQAGNEISAAAGDLNGDGKDEIGFCVGNRFVILDGNLSSVLYDGWATPSNSADTSSTTIHPSRVAAGDIKGDGSVAFVVTYGVGTASTAGSYKVIGGSSPTVLTSGGLSGNGCPYTLLYANVALGDLDGDGRKEVIFAGPSSTNSPLCNVVVAAGNSSNSNLAFLTSGAQVAYTTWDYHPIAALVAFNPDGKINNDRDILLAGNTVLCYDASQKTFSTGYKGLSTTTPIAMPVYALAAAADLNYDSQDELITLSSDPGVGFEIFSLGSANSFTRKTISATIGNYMSLCAADLSGQSLVLQYLGTSVKYTNPQIIAVLASPPYNTADSGNSAFGNTCTSLGKSTGLGDSSSNSITVSAGVSVGFQGDMPLWGDTLAETDKVTVSASFSYGFEKEQEISYTHAYATMAGKDSVIYNCIPFDVYSYKILSAPNSASVGDTMTVDFPRTPQVIQMERSAFNGLPGNTIKIGSSVLSHTVGDPRSYPNRAAVASSCAAGGIYDPTGMAAPSGDGQYSTDTVSVSSSNSKTIGGGVSIDASVEFTILGALFGVETGFSDEFSYTTKTTNSTEFSGSVPGTLNGSRSFTFGIAGYNVADKAVQQAPFMVVTYWVE